MPAPAVPALAVSSPRVRKLSLAPTESFSPRKRHTKLPKHDASGEHFSAAMARMMKSLNNSYRLVRKAETLSTFALKGLEERWKQMIATTIVDEVEEEQPTPTDNEPPLTPVVDGEEPIASDGAASGSGGAGSGPGEEEGEEEAFNEEEQAMMNEAESVKSKMNAKGKKQRRRGRFNKRYAAEHSELDALRRPGEEELLTSGSDGEGEVTSRHVVRRGQQSTAAPAVATATTAAQTPHYVAADHDDEVTSDIYRLWESAMHQLADMEDMFYSFAVPIATDLKALYAWSKKMEAKSKHSPALAAFFVNPPRCVSGVESMAEAEKEQQLRATRALKEKAHLRPPPELAYLRKANHSMNKFMMELNDYDAGNVREHFKRFDAVTQTVAAPKIITFDVKMQTEPDPHSVELETIHGEAAKLKDTAVQFLSSFNYVTKSAFPQVVREATPPTPPAVSLDESALGDEAPSQPSADASLQASTRALAASTTGTTRKSSAAGSEPAEEGEANTPRSSEASDAPPAASAAALLAMEIKRCTDVLDNLTSDMVIRGAGHLYSTLRADALSSNKDKACEADILLPRSGEVVDADTMTDALLLASPYFSPTGLGPLSPHAGRSPMHLGSDSEELGTPSPQDPQMQLPQSVEVETTIAVHDSGEVTHYNRERIERLIQDNRRAAVQLSESRSKVAQMVVQLARTKESEQIQQENEAVRAKRLDESLKAIESQSVLSTMQVRQRLEEVEHDLEAATNRHTLCQQELQNSELRFRLEARKLVTEQQRVEELEEHLRRVQMEKSDTDTALQALLAEVDELRSGGGNDAVQRSAGYTVERKSRRDAGVMAKPQCMTRSTHKDAELSVDVACGPLPMDGRRNKQVETDPPPTSNKFIETDPPRVTNMGCDALKPTPMEDAATMPEFMPGPAKAVWAFPSTASKLSECHIIVPDGEVAPDAKRFVDADVQAELCRCPHPGDPEPEEAPLMEEETVTMQLGDVEGMGNADVLRAVISQLSLRKQSVATAGSAEFPAVDVGAMVEADVDYAHIAEAPHAAPLEAPDDPAPAEEVASVPAAAEAVRVAAAPQAAVVESAATAPQPEVSVVLDNVESNVSAIDSPLSPPSLSTLPSPAASPKATPTPKNLPQPLLTPAEIHKASLREKGLVRKLSDSAILSPALPPKMAGGFLYSGNETPVVIHMNMPKKVHTENEYVQTQPPPPCATTMTTTDDLLAVDAVHTQTAAGDFCDTVTTFTQTYASTRAASCMASVMATEANTQATPPPVSSADFTTQMRPIVSEFGLQVYPERPGQRNRTTQVEPEEPCNSEVQTDDVEFTGMIADTSADTSPVSVGRSVKRCDVGVMVCARSRAAGSQVAPSVMNSGCMAEVETTSVSVGVAPKTKCHAVQAVTLAVPTITRSVQVITMQVATSTQYEWHTFDANTQTESQITLAMCLPSDPAHLFDPSETQNVTGKTPSTFGRRAETPSQIEALDSPVATWKFPPQVILHQTHPTSERRSPRRHPPLVPPVSLTPGPRPVSEDEIHLDDRWKWSEETPTSYSTDSFLSTKKRLLGGSVRISMNNAAFSDETTHDAMGRTLQRNRAVPTAAGLPLPFVQSRVKRTKALPRFLQPLDSPSPQSGRQPDP